MTIYKQIEFSGIFEKVHEQDEKPIQIDNVVISFHIDGTVILEVSSEFYQQISRKQGSEVGGYSLEIPSNVDQNDPFWLFNYAENQESRRISKKAYRGDYKISGIASDNQHVNAIVGKNHPWSVTRKNVDEISYLKLRNINISSEDDFFDGDNLKEISYGLSNIEIDSEFTFSLEAINTHVVVKPVKSKNSDQVHEISVEIHLTQKVIEQTETAKSNESIEIYGAWIISLLSFISGKKVNEVYKKRVFYTNGTKISKEEWFGYSKDIPKGVIAVIQRPHFPLFFKSCCQEINEEVFLNKGLGLALHWYINSFYSSSCEVNFLLLCTVLESLNEKQKRLRPRLLSPSNYRKIRKKIFQVIDTFKEEVEDNAIDKYSIFEDKIQKIFTEKGLNRMGSIRANLKIMLEAYGVVYQDLFPELEFVGTRDVIVHQGWSQENVFLNSVKLSNLTTRLFLGLLKYEGVYIEYEGVYIERNIEDSFYSRRYRKYPIEM